MNAAEQRRLTPVLVVLCLLAALLLIALLAGIGRGVHWGAHGPAARLPVAAAAMQKKTPPLQRFATVWQQPLFNADRKPVMESEQDAANVNLGDLHLTGIIITPNLRMALLRDHSGNSVRVQEGSSLPKGGWMLQKLAPRSAIFTSNGQRRELKLEVAADIDANAGAGNGHGFAGGSQPGNGIGRAVPAQNHPAMQPHPAHGKAALRMKASHEREKRNRKQAAQQAAGQREKESRIQALKARIESRRRQMKAQQDQGH